MVPYARRGVGPTGSVTVIDENARQRFAQQTYAQDAATYTQGVAIEAASAEAEKNRKYKREAFDRFSKLLSPMLTQQQVGESAPGGDSAQQALTASIEQRGKERAGKLRSMLAKRGIFRSNVGVAAEAKLEGETEANIAGARAGFSESASERRSRERIARKQSMTQIASSFAQGAGAFL